MEDLSANLSADGNVERRASHRLPVVQVIGTDDEILIDNQMRDLKENPIKGLGLGPGHPVNRTSIDHPMMPQVNDVPVNEINGPCKNGKLQSCVDCYSPPLSLEEFKTRVVYQAVKLGNSTQGILPLCEKENRQFDQDFYGFESVQRSEQEFDCEFLDEWIKKNRRCKFLIVVAMYNEVCDEFHGTLEGIQRNIEYFVNGEYSAKIEEIGVVFIIDGIEPFLKSFLKIDGGALKDDQKRCFRKNFLYFSQFFNVDVIQETLGVEDVLKKDKVNKDDFELMKDLCESGVIKEGQEIAHLFCQKLKYTEDYSLNTIFCVKQLNKRKLNTHRWFFEGFCVRINPDYVALLDVGTIPEKQGLYLLFEAMEQDDRIAGCCGEIIPEDTKSCNPVVQAQIVEYKFAHIMDKGLESIIGYVSVLPGAFSAYRWEALNEPKTLEAYFYSQRPGKVLDLFNANMYLAEDRILCMELVCQKGKSNILRYVKGSVAVTDVPDTINTLMAQRRRWINGSWFSMIYTIKNCNRIGDSSHSRLRKCLFKSLMFYYAIIAIFNWVLVGAFYLAFAVSIKMNLGENNRSQDKLTKWSEPVVFLYGCLLCTILLTAFAVKPNKIERFFKFLCLLFGIYTYVTIVLIVLYLFRNGFDIHNWQNEISASMIILLALIFIIIIFLNFRTAIKPVSKGVIWYIFMTGTYVNMFFIYSMCNIHDVSWGNRPDKMSKEEKEKTEEYKNERTRWVLVWIFFNASFAYLSGVVTGSGTTWGRGYIIMLGVFAYIVIIIKFIGGLLYIVDETCCVCLHKNKKKED